MHKRNNPYISVSLDLSEACNLNCRYCYKGSLPQTIGAQWEPGVDRLWSRAKEMGGLGIWFMGAEPLITYDEMMACVQKLKRRCEQEGVFFTWGMTTNGTLITNERAQEIRGTGGRVQVSLDGDRKTHDYQRPLRSGKGSYDAVMSGLDSLKSAFGDLRNINIRGTFTEKHVDDVYHNLLSMSALGFSQIAYFPEDIKDGWSDKAYDKLKGIAAQIFRERHSTFRSVNRLVPFDRFTRKYPNAIQGRKHHCGAGRSIFGVSVRGEVVPCHRFTGKPAQDLVLGADGWERASQILEGALSPDCSTCPLFQRACHGGCWAVSYYDNGDLAANSRHACRWQKDLWDEGSQFRLDNTKMTTQEKAADCAVCVSCENCYSGCDSCNGCHGCERCVSCEVCVNCESTCQTCESCNTSCDGCDGCERCNSSCDGCETCHSVNCDPCYNYYDDPERCQRCHGYSD